MSEEKQTPAEGMKIAPTPEFAANAHIHSFEQYQELTAAGS